MKSILDPSFRYTSSVDTDLKKTFARLRREQRKGKATTMNTENADRSSVQMIHPTKRVSA